MTGPAFYVDGQLYRTVNTPTDLSNTGAPASSFDTIYQFFGVQPFNVATAAPGDAGYNGGRWLVHGLEFDDYAAAVDAFDSNGSGDFDSDEEVAAALAAGAATDIGVVKSFAGIGAADDHALFTTRSARCGMAGAQRCTYFRCARRRAVCS